MRRGLLALALLAPAWLSGCAQHGPSVTAEHTMRLRPVAFSGLPGWSSDHPAQAMPALLAGCAALAAAPDRLLGGSGEAAARGGTAARWLPACSAATAVPADDDGAARAFFETQFQPYAVTDSAGASLFTGYYEPEVNGSRTPAGGYDTPLLGRPGDLVQVDLGAFSPDLRGKHVTGRLEGGQLVPYYDRAAIVDGALASRGLELLWLADPVDAFVLQIQGSGRVRLPDGHTVRVSYAGQNGRPYVPLGRVLAERGAMPLAQVSMRSIRVWLAAHPDQAASVMDRNPSYVFFRELDDLHADQGPPGALGASLTPGRSIAVDGRFIPLGAPVFIATTDPRDNRPLDRLMLAQDLGGAIRGPVRADIFWGWDSAAEDRAGRMNAHGMDYLLLPRAGQTTAAQTTAAR